MKTIFKIAIIWLRSLIILVYFILGVLPILGVVIQGIEPIILLALILTIPLATLIIIRSYNIIKSTIKMVEDH